MKRRTFLKSASGAFLYGGLIADLARPALAMTPAQIAGTDADLHLLRRISFGPTLQELERVRRIGRTAYVDEQLEALDLPTELIVSTQYPLINTGSTAAFLGSAGGALIDLHLGELQSAMLYRAIYSGAQLRELMVDFWNDHFNTYLRKNPVPLKADFDRDVIRRHALGNFKAMLRATVRHPEMLHFLDNWLNTRESINENYARELLELHTLGKEGGYTEDDMKALARILTGLGYVRDEPLAPLLYGQVRFVRERHDDGSKVFLGVRFPAGGGEEEIDRALDLICDHPGTARHIAHKLCCRFVADDPPLALVARVADVFIATDGEIRPMLRAILSSPEFEASAGQKVKRPLEAMIGALRACGINRFDHLLNVDVFGAPLLGTDGQLFQSLVSAGHEPFGWVHPDGYPDAATYWGNASSILQQQRFCVRFVEGLAFGRVLSNPMGFLFGGQSVAAAVTDARTPRQAVLHACGNLLFASLPPAATDAAVAFVAQDVSPDDELSADVLEPRVKGLVFALLSSPWFLLR